MISEARGNLLEADVEALVNTVNTVGVMGKGIALQFKRAFPANFKAYQAACKRGDVELGRVMVYDTGQLLEKPRYIINFPTKGHWRSNSRASDVREGLKDLARVIRELGIRSIAVPPLGCGNGGLRWGDVRSMIMDALGDLDGVEVLVFEPSAPPVASEMRIGGVKPKLTRARVVVLEALDRYVGPFGGGATPVEVQKVVYFVERFGEPLGLSYSKAQYGPYSDKLTHLISDLEGHYVSGFGDGTKRVAEAEPLVVLEAGRDEWMEVIREMPDALDHVERALSFLDGFETAYGMELLATVDWAASREGAGLDHDEVMKVIQGWNRRKAQLFLPEHVQIAIDRLSEFGLVA